jgi:hypothetical protein
LCQIEKNGLVGEKILYLANSHIIIITTTTTTIIIIITQLTYIWATCSPVPVSDFIYL